MTQQEFLDMIHAVTQHSGQTMSKQHLLIALAILGGRATYRELEALGLPRRSAGRLVHELQTAGLVRAEIPGAPTPTRITLTVSCPEHCGYEGATA